jgi:hypothetical protein
MTLEIPADVIAAENKAVAGLFGQDNPNPALGIPDSIPDAPADQGADGAAERPLSIREQIAERAKAARNAPAEETTQTEMGEYVPPFLRRQQEAADAEAADTAREEEEARRTSEAPKTYTLKVRGNDVPVSSRDELMQLAEVDAEDASTFTDAALIKLAQKQMAANAILDEAKQAKKSARIADRADEGDTSPDPSAQDDDETPPARQPNQQDEHRKVIEAIQFGDPEEAGVALRDYLHRGVNEALTRNQIDNRVSAVETMIESATRTFEEANADLVADEDFADLLYNKHLVAEFKKDLRAAGLPQERIDATLGNHISKAMQAYIAVAADGRVKLRTPDRMLADAAASMRTKYNRPAPNRERAPTAAATPGHDRIAAKRSLVSQPSRASVPQSTAVQKNGQTPAARSGVVSKMRAQRGQGG